MHALRVGPVFQGVLGGHLSKASRAPKRILLDGDMQLHVQGRRVVNSPLCPRTYRHSSRVKMQASRFG